MPYSLGPSSQKKLGTCHPVWRKILDGAITASPMDFTVLSGWRGEGEQNALVASGKSKSPWPQSKHNHTKGGAPCSLAVDIAPWWRDEPHIRWDSPNEFRWLAGFVMGYGAAVAAASGFRIRWGGDWDSDGDHSKLDNPFMDLPHLELVPL